MRLFTALEIPPDVIRNLESFLARVKPTARITWSPVSNLHITTKFIGAWPDEKLDTLQGALRSIPPRPAIDVKIHKVGFFPNPHSPRNFWCGIDAPGIAELAADTDRATAVLGIESEKRAYSPHLTLARIKDRPNLQPLEAAIAASDPLEFGSFRSAAFSLYQSQLLPTGSVYTKLAEFPFSK
jgi:2'-5' RNA ligase